MSRVIDLTGMRFGRLVVLSLDAKRAAGGGSKWLCRCDCGIEKIVTGQALNHGKTRSCGCFGLERFTQRVTTHGRSKEKLSEHGIWALMRRRCNNPKDKRYADYGGRGITVCARWDSFENFLADMGPMPDGTSLERRNNDLGYSPDNCKWATRKEQQRNRRTNRLVTFRGETKTIVEWSELLGIAENAIRTRLDRGWSVDDALTFASDTGKRKYGKTRLAIEVGAPRTSSGEWTVDVGEIATVDANGDVVTVGT